MFCGFGEQDPDLVRVGEPVADSSLDLWVLTHADLRSSARIRACMDMLIDAMHSKEQFFMPSPAATM